VTELPEHGRRRLPPRAPERHRVARVPFGDHLDASVAGQSLECFGRHHGPVLGLDVAPARQRLERGVDHDGRPVGVGVVRDAL
jgi:hypothetical protein